MTATVPTTVPTTATTRRTPREAWTGIAFPVLFAAGVLVSSPPADDASNAKWLTNYTGHSEQARHLATGLLLVLAGLSLAAFLTALWRRIRVGRPDTSAFPLVAAAVSGACISAGGVVMGYVSGGELIGKYPLPSADLLRLSNDLGFALVGVAGMLATAAAVAVLSAQGRAAGLFGRKTYVLGIVTSVALLAALAFIPIIVLLLWSLVVAVQWLRG